MARVSLIVALSCAAVLIAVPSVTSAAYTDTAASETSAQNAPLTTNPARLTPVQTHLPGTTVALQDDGTLWVWGFRGYGLAGNGVDTVDSTDPPTPVVLPDDGHPGRAHRFIVKVAGTSDEGVFVEGPQYTGLAALSDDGQVYTWGGINVFGVMGRPSTTTPYNRPGLVTIPGRVVDLTSSATVFMALTDAGDLYTWGYAQGRGVSGQGSPDSTDVIPVRILSGVHSIAAGYFNGWAIRGNNAPGDNATGVFWWGWANPSPGSNPLDPSGDGLGISRNAPTRAARLSALATAGCDTVGVEMGSADDGCSIRSLGGNTFGSQLVLATGQLMTWGDGTTFGTGRPNIGTADSNTPTAVPLPNGDTVASITVTSDYVQVLGGSRTLYIYGRYSLRSGPDPISGAASTANLAAPTQISGLGLVVAIGGSGYTGTALRSDGTFVSWGGGNLIDNTNAYAAVRNAWVNSTTPTAIQGLTPMIPPGA